MEGGLPSMCPLWIHSGLGICFYWLCLGPVLATVTMSFILTTSCWGALLPSCSFSTTVVSKTVEYKKKKNLPYIFK